VILNHADLRILFVGVHEQFEAALEVADNCPLLEKIVCMKSQEISLIRPLAHTKVENWNDFIAYASQDKQTELNQRLADKNLSDLFTLIYTSGT
ncbi:long-chain fatty acid--CoA ligase, partial [Xanthomonas citri pv. citri]|nr:long-chain fatty acid--CoA ligase [Xanthomonas citri pv. citri]